ncbi:unnamed protein product [Meganyctiphanes norvegica]|uniref:Fatty acid hydroxylase domain-containing protein n=1 Tax=Meganyctiphanes norvegica TaxID=48144 RepID=A0AAV2SCI0_MEGNR
MESIPSCVLPSSKSLQSSLTSICTSIGVFFLGATVKGEWLHILIHLYKAIGINQSEDNATDYNYYALEQGAFIDHPPRTPLDISLGMQLSSHLNAYYMRGLHTHLMFSITLSFASYFIIGGGLYWYYYIHLRDRASEWKIQPDKFPSTKTQIKEIVQGSSSLLLCSIISGILSCYTANEGPSRIYYNISDYGWIWYAVSCPLAFTWQDYLTYWMHRLMHVPWLYKRVHKVHHAYKQPTAFSVTAFHPVELICLQAILWSPMFIFPLHWSVFVGILMYVYYHGLLDHSGINFKAQWWQPWQPDCIFHDDHHHHTHYNFGVNIGTWDKIYGTQFKNKAYAK